MTSARISLPTTRCWQLKTSESFAHCSLTPVPGPPARARRGAREDATGRRGGRRGRERPASLARAHACARRDHADFALSRTRSRRPARARARGGRGHARRARRAPSTRTSFLGTLLMGSSPGLAGSAFTSSFAGTALTGLAAAAAGFAAAPAATGLTGSAFATAAAAGLAGGASDLTAAGAGLAVASAGGGVTAAAAAFPLAAGSTCEVVLEAPHPMPAAGSRGGCAETSVTDHFRTRLPPSYQSGWMK
jgi:hypothetical protein